MTQAPNSVPPVVIHWGSLLREEEPFVRVALEGLKGQLAVRYPTLPTLNLVELSLSELELLPDYFRDGLTTFAPQAEPLRALSSKSLFIYCDQAFPPAVAAREANPMAEWGVASPGLYALAWTRNKWLVWHEAMHLLCAEDCYGKYGPCEEGRCLMQYEPTEENCGPDLVLCSKNVRRIINLAM